MLLAAGRANAHDLERTQVTLTFASDGAFVLDVANDANWLRLRLEDFARDYPGLTPAGDTALSDAQRDARLAAFAPTFADRVVLWIDHAEVRPTSAEYLPPRRGMPSDPAIGTFRLRGRVPVNAHTLQWFYGIVVDPYPLAIHRADKRLTTEAVLGNAWSESIDLTGQFHEPNLAQRTLVSALRGKLWLALVLALSACALAVFAKGMAWAR